MPNEVTLIVNSVAYAGWKSISITQSIESLCGSFSLGVSDRWGPSDPWPIAEGDACTVRIDDNVVIDGYVDKRAMSASASSRTLSYTGRDRAGALVNCSVLVPDASTKGNKWTYRNLDILQFATQIAAQRGIKVSVAPGVVLKKDPLLVAHPGETGFEAIKRAAASSAVLVVSDSAGGIVITGPGSARATALIEGVNIKEGSIEFDATDRFYRYIVSSQPPGTDDAYGEALRVQAQAIDLDVAHQDRVLLIRPDRGMDTATARRHADWEARIRAAKSATATITVQGWEQADGELWKVNTLTHVTAPRMLGLDGNMLISQVEFTVSDAGQVAVLHVVRPDAFTPEPQAVVSGQNAFGVWPELANGAK